VKGINNDVHSLLQNGLGVPLPLHISLSRPLTLKTEQRDGFFQAMKKAVSSSGVKAFTTSFEQLQWHPNEDRTRWFLVLRADNDHELMKLLRACNYVADLYNQPRLYEDDGHGTSECKKRDPTSHEQESQVSKKFHISIAWSLQEQSENGVAHASEASSDGGELPSSVRDLGVVFNEVKVRIGQDVTSLSLVQKRRRSSVILA
jgi:hypothetical protein